VICTDCANGADHARLAGIPDLGPELTARAAAIATDGHDRCRARNHVREPGQSADCTCQHAPSAPNPRT
jgi:hypothetical protein